MSLDGVMEEKIRLLLIDALGGPDAVPEGVSTLELAYAVQSQSGGYRNGLKAAASVNGRWADRLTEYIETAPAPDSRVVAVRDALNRHRGC